MGIADTLRSAGLWPEERSDPTISIDQWLEMFSYNGVGYPLGLNQTLGQKADEIGSDFTGMVQGAYRSNGVVFACMLARQMLFSEARFQFRQVKNGRPGDLFGTKELSVLEKPWPNGTTGSMLTRALQDVDLAGNAYMVRRRGSDRIVRARPDWITIVMRSNRPPDETLTDDLDAELVGYLFHPGGVRGTRDPIPLLPEEVAHFAPHPDPTARYRGESWLSPIIREIQADQAATTHKLKFFENGATPNLIVKTEIASPEAMEKWAGFFERENEGVRNAYKKLVLGHGMDATVVGTDLQQLDFKVTQGAGEVRICNAARIPPIIVGVSEGLNSATYSNYAQARRAFADGTMRPLWREAAGSFASIVNVPGGSELWYDSRDISFLQEDGEDKAKIQQIEAVGAEVLRGGGLRARIGGPGDPQRRPLSPHPHRPDLGPASPTGHARLRAHSTRQHTGRGDEACGRKTRQGKSNQQRLRRHTEWKQQRLRSRKRPRAPTSSGQTPVGSRCAPRRKAECRRSTATSPPSTSGRRSTRSSRATSWSGLAPGAFKKTFREQRNDIKVLFQHGREFVQGDKPLGPIEVLEEDEIGARYSVPLVDAPYVRELIPGLEAGLYGASFRFQVMKESSRTSPSVPTHNPDGIPGADVAGGPPDGVRAGHLPRLRRRDRGRPLALDEFNIFDQLGRDPERARELFAVSPSAPSRR
jgi:HK97 family phage portal protein